MKQHKKSNLIINILIVIILILTIYTSYTLINLKILKKDYINIFGYTYFKVASGSMSPAIKTNDIVIIKLKSKYKKGDIITYKNKEGYVTHRITNITKNKVITKGDANNLRDALIDKKNIIGKVKIIIPKLGLTKKIMLSYKVVTLFIITMFIINLTYSYKKTDSKNFLNIDNINLEKLIILLKIDALIILIIILLNLIPTTISRYDSTATGNTTTNIAFYLLEPNYQTQNIKLTTLAPSNTPYVYTFSVSNYTSNATSDVDLEYILKIVTTTNLPLTYKLYKNEDYTSNTSTNLVTNETTTIEADSDGTYFKYITLGKEQLYYNQPKINNYTLLIYYSEANASEMYQNTIESIRIVLESNQIIDE